MKTQQFAYFNGSTPDQSEIAALYASANDDLSETISESIAFSSSTEVVNPEFFHTVTEGLRFGDLYNNTPEFKEALHETLKFSYSIFRTITEQIAESIKYSDSNTSVITKIEAIIEKLSFSDSFSSSAEMTSAISLVLTFLDDIRVISKDRIVETIVFDDEFKSRYETYAKLVETILFGLTAKLGFTVLIQESIKFSNSVSQHAQLYSAIENGLSFALGMRVPGGDFIAYAVNTKTGGISEYNDSSFNSMDFPLACKSDGIYRIDGDSDDSVIASIKTGLMDFGTSLKKQVPNIYLGITNNERIVAKTITIEQGIKKERYYEVKSYNEANDTTRGDFGRGVKSKYWQFELSEIKDRIESFEVLYNVTARRK